MMNSLGPFTLFAVLLLSAVSATTELPNWNRSYYISGKLYRPFSDNFQIEFVSWYDLPNKRSRIDYYVGKNQWCSTFQLPGLWDGTLYKITQVSDAYNDKWNYPDCSKMYNTSFIQPALPNTDGFVYEKNDTHRGRQCALYSRNHTWGYRYYGERLWMSSREPHKPIGYEKQIFNLDETPTPDVQERLVIEYSTYEQIAIDPETFIPDNTEGCNSLESVALLNPIGNYIDNKVEVFHNKTYNVDSNDYRNKIFTKNMLFINRTNDEKHSYKLGINYFTDRTDDEIGAMIGLSEDTSKRDYSTKELSMKAFSDSTFPERLDWSQKGAVNFPEDPLYCRSSYAFVAAGLMEGADFMRTGKLLKLSKQVIIEASFNRSATPGEYQLNNRGCRGGNLPSSLEWIDRMHGLPLAGNYKEYLGIEGISDLPAKELLAKPHFFSIETGSNVDRVKILLTNFGPISVTISNARILSFLFYADGIYDDPLCDQNDDPANMIAALLVGYESFKGREYWIVRNSWGSHWGRNGYIHIAMANNTCGILKKIGFVITTA